MKPHLLSTTALALALGSCSGDGLLGIGPRARSSPLLVPVPTCEELREALVAHRKEEARVALLSGGGGFAVDGGPGLGGPDLAVDGAEAGSGDDAASSGTNNQEVGVDEADFVKLVGGFLYVLDGPRLEILELPEPGALEHVSTTTLEGVPHSLLVAGDRLVALTTVPRYALPAAHPLADALGGTPSTEPGAAVDAAVPAGADLFKLTVLDVADRAAPLVERELYVEGELRAARAVGSTVRVVSLCRRPVEGLVTWPALPGSFHELDDAAREAAWDRAVADAVAANDARLEALTLDELLPRAFERMGGALAPADLFGPACGSFSIPADGTGRDLTSILTLDLATPGASLEADHVVSNRAVVYASTDTLVLAEPANEDWWYWNQDDFDEATNLHVFDVSSDGRTAYRTSARIPGSVSGSFGVSEHDGVLRVATTTGLLTWRPEAPESHVFVLAGEESLELVGRLDGIAPGERLWASRFAGDRAYLVTFRNVDPLWTIDLSDPAAPRIRGELEVPGVSTYVHPLGEDHLLAVGYGGTEVGLSWTSEVSLFDVSDFAAPLLQDRLTLAPPGGWAESAQSEALHDHLAFQYWAPLGLLAVPVAGASAVDGGWSYLSTLELVAVDPAAGLSVHGSIDHSEFFDAAGEVHWDTPQVRRSFFVGEHVVAVSGRGVTVHHAPTLERTAAVLLHGDDGDVHWDL